MVSVYGKGSGTSHASELKALCQVSASSESLIFAEVNSLGAVLGLACIIVPGSWCQVSGIGIIEAVRKTSSVTTNAINSLHVRVADCDVPIIGVETIHATRHFAPSELSELDGHINS